MKILGLGIKQDRKKSQWSMQNCYKCAKLLWVSKTNTRVYNYCGDCK